MEKIKLDKETSNALIEAINNSEPPLVINDEETALAFVEAIEESEKDKLCQIIGESCRSQPKLMCNYVL